MYFKLKQNFKQPIGKLLQNADVKACLSDLRNKYVFVPADKAPNNIRSICKRYYIKTLINYLSHSPSYGQKTSRVVPNTPPPGRIGLKNWDWVIAPLQQETQPTLHVKCHLKTLSIHYDFLL